MRQQAKFTLYKEGFTPITIRRWSDTEDENYYYEILCHVQRNCASGGHHERWERVKGFTNAEVELHIEKYAQQSVQRTGGESGQQNLFTVDNLPPAKVTAKSPRR